MIWHHNMWAHVNMYGLYGYSFCLNNLKNILSQVRAKSMDTWYGVQRQMVSMVPWTLLQNLLGSSKRSSSTSKNRALAWKQLKKRKMTQLLNREFEFANWLFAQETHLFLQTVEQFESKKLRNSEGRTARRSSEKVTSESGGNLFSTHTLTEGSHFEASKSNRINKRKSWD